MPVAVPSAAEIDLWQAYAEARSGMAFDGPRARVLAAAVAHRAEAGRHPTTLAYYHHLLHSSDPRGEWEALFGRLLNGETSFFRDGPAFALLADRLLPELRQRQPDRPLALWSAGCSTGQEAYSLALCGLAGGPVRVTGTDAGRAALARARAGVYRAHELRALPEWMVGRYFVPAEGGWRVAPAVRAVVEFHQLDLLAPAGPPQDVIFCQNVLIYYRPATRAAIVGRLTETLAPGGYLVLGAADGLGLPTPGLVPVGPGDVCIYGRAG